MPVELSVVESVTALETTVVTVVLDSSSAPGVAGPGVPTGGTAGQVLTKDSGTDYDTSWQDATGGAGGGAPDDATYLVTTANPDLAAEVVVGATPGGELGGTWASPTVDATHSGSSHASVQAAAEATAAAALAAHEADTTSVHGIADTSALDTVSGRNTAIAAHEADTTSVHGIADTSALALTANVQPLDSDLTAIAALTTTAFGRGLLELANSAALLAAAGAQASDSDLTAIAGLTPTNDDVIQRKAGAWTNRTLAQLIADLAALGTTFQPLDSDLTAIAALTTTSFGRGLLAEASAASLRATLDLEAGTDFPSLTTFNDHSTRHESGGGDAIKLDDLAATDDNTDLNASTSAHGLLKKLDNDTSHFLRGDGAWAAPSGGGLFNAYALLQDQQANGNSTMGGQFSSTNTFIKRTLNTEVSDIAGIVSLSSSAFTLQAGTYLIKARAPAYKADRHKVKLRNTTDSSDAIIGESTFAGAADSDASYAELTGVVTIAAQKTFELQHAVQTNTESARGPGYEANMSVIEVYAQVEIYRFS